MNFWKEFQADINYYIYEALNQIAFKFIESNENIFKCDEEKEFEIYTNYMDSHIYFQNEKIQSEFEKFY